MQMESPTIIAKSPADEMLSVHAIETKQIRRSFAMSLHSFVDIAENAPEQFEFIRGLDYIIPT